MDAKTSNVMRKSRIGYIDIFRALGILLMVIGHTEFSWTLNTYIHSFHMPMFFFISGFLFRENRPWRPFVQKKIRTLIVPYLAFGIVAIAIVYFGKPSVFPQKLSAFLLYSTEEYPLASAMWFPMALFVCNIVYYAIDRFIGNAMLKNGIILVLSIFGQVFSHVTHIILPYAMGPAFVGVGLMHIGKLMKRYEQQIISLNPFIAIALALLGTALAFAEGVVSMRTGSYQNILLFWPAAIVNITVVLYFSALLDRRFNQSPLNKYLVKVGNDSMVYVLFNQQCIKVGEALTQRFLPGLIQKPVSLLISLSLLYICAEVINRTKLRILIGKS